MVALTSRFTILAAFVALASSPLPASAAVIPKSEKASYAARSFDLAQRAFSLHQAKAAKRDFDDDCDNFLCVVAVGTKTQIFKRGHRESPWSLRKQRKHGKTSYSVVRTKHSKHRNGHVGRAEAQTGTGKIALINDSDKNDAGNTLGHLVVDSTPTSPDVYPVDASSEKSSDFTLVQQNRTSANEVIVQLQWLVDEKNFECMGYNKSDSTGQLFVSPCNATGPAQQSFLYNTDTNNLQPLPSPSEDSDSSSAQSILGREDAQPPTDVVLRWEPKDPGANAEALIEVSSSTVPQTSTMTTTVTVTNTPMVTPSAANFEATSSGGPSLSATLTSTSTGVAPTGTPGVNGTAGSAGVLDVEVVQPSNGSSTMLNATSTAISSAAPTTTLNAQDAASSAAVSSTNISTAADVSSTSTVPVPSGRAYRR